MQVVNFLSYALCFFNSLRLILSDNHSMLFLSIFMLLRLKHIEYIGLSDKLLTRFTSFFYSTGIPIKTFFFILIKPSIKIKIHFYVKQCVFVILVESLFDPLIDWDISLYLLHLMISKTSLACLYSVEYCI